MADNLDLVLVGLDTGRKARAHARRRMLPTEPPAWWSVQDELDCSADEARAACRAYGFDPVTGERIEEER